MTHGQPGFPSGFKSERRAKPDYAAQVVNLTLVSDLLCPQVAARIVASSPLREWPSARLAGRSLWRDLL